MFSLSDIWFFDWDRVHSKMLMLEESSGKFSKPAAGDGYLAASILRCWHMQRKDSGTYNRLFTSPLGLLRP